MSICKLALELNDEHSVVGAKRQSMPPQSSEHAVG